MNRLLFRVLCCALIIFEVMNGLPVSVLSAGSEQARMRVAIVEFEVQGDVDIRDAGKMAAEMLITELGKTSEFDLKERILLQKVLREQLLSSSGVIDEGSAVKIGKLYGVEAIITGSVMKWGKTIRVNARLVNTESGSIINTYNIEAADINDVPFKMANLARIVAEKVALSKIGSVDFSADWTKRVEQESRLKAEQEAKLKAEQESKLKAEQESKLKAEQEAKLKAEQESKLKAEQESKLKAEQESRLKAEQEAKLAAEQQSKLNLEQMSKRNAEREGEISPSSGDIAGIWTLRDSFRGLNYSVMDLRQESGKVVGTIKTAAGGIIDVEVVKRDNRVILDLWFKNKGAVEMVLDRMQIAHRAYNPHVEVLLQKRSELHAQVVIDSQSEGEIYGNLLLWYPEFSYGRPTWPDWPTGVKIQQPWTPTAAKEFPAIRIRITRK